MEDKKEDDGIVLSGDWDGEAFCARPRAGIELVLGCSGKEEFECTVFLDDAQAIELIQAYFAAKKAHPDDKVELRFRSGLIVWHDWPKISDQYRILENGKLVLPFEDEEDELTSSDTTADGSVDGPR